MQAKESQRADYAEQRDYLARLIALKPRPEELFNPDTGQADFAKQAAMIRAENAEADLARIAAKESKLASEAEALRESIVSREQHLAFLEIQSFVTNIAPEYLPTTTDFLTAYAKYSRKEALDESDWVRMHELTQILAEAELPGADIQRVYQYKRSHGQLTVGGAQTSNAGRGLPSPRNKDEELVNRINKLRERANLAPSRLPGDRRGSVASAGGAKTREQLALEHIQSERVADGLLPNARPEFEGKIITPQRTAGT